MDEKNSIEKSRLEIIVQRLLALIVFLLPWQTIWIVQERFINGVKWEYGTQGFYAVELLVWFTAVLFMYWFWQRSHGHVSIQTWKPTKDRLCILAALLFIAYLYISAFWAPVPDLAIQQAQRVMAGFVLFLMLFLGPLSAKQAVLSFVAGALVQAALGIVQFFFQTTFSSSLLGIAAHLPAEPGSSVIVNTSGRWLRAYGAFAHPNIFGGYLVLSFVAARSLFALSEKISPVYQCVVYAILGIALFATGSRSAWLGLGLFFLFELHRVMQKKQKESSVFLITLIVTGASLLLVFSPIINTRVRGGSLNEARSTQERVASIPQAIDIISSAVVAGVGAGNYTAALFEEDQSLPGWEYQPVHNLDLLFLAELGLIGTTLFLLGLFYFCDTWIQINGIKKFGIFGLLILYIAPMAVLDHYLWTSWVGIAMSGAFFGIMLRKDGYLSTV